MQQEKKEQFKVAPIFNTVDIADKGLGNFFDLGQGLGQTALGGFFFRLVLIHANNCLIKLNTQRHEPVLASNRRPQILINFCLQLVNHRLGLDLFGQIG